MTSRQSPPEIKDGGSAEIPARGNVPHVIYIDDSGQPRFAPQTGVRLRDGVATRTVAVGGDINQEILEELRRMNAYLAILAGVELELGESQD